MRKISITELHVRTSELVREASGGTVIVIEKRGQAVAEPSPLPAARPKPRSPDMSRFWKDFPEVAGDSGKFLEEDR
jgi:antitoxin (DNA-binding transcriptional repressor) of toxin-antitoxin stability system